RITLAAFGIGQLPLPEIETSELDMTRCITGPDLNRLFVIRLGRIVHLQKLTKTSQCAVGLCIRWFESKRGLKFLFCRLDLSLDAPDLTHSDVGGSKMVVELKGTGAMAYSFIQQCGIFLKVIDAQEGFGQGRICGRIPRILCHRVAQSAGTEFQPLDAIGLTQIASSFNVEFHGSRI